MIALMHSLTFFLALWLLRQHESGPSFVSITIWTLICPMSVINLLMYAVHRPNTHCMLNEHQISRGTLQYSDAVTVINPLREIATTTLDYRCPTLLKFVSRFYSAQLQIRRNCFLWQISSDKVLARY